MKTRLWIPLLATVMIAGGCQSDQKAQPQTLSNVSVRTSYSPNAKFPAGSQYAFVTVVSTANWKARLHW